MKLVLAKLKYNLPAIIIVVGIGGIFLYYSIERILQHNENEVLKLYKESVINMLNAHPPDEVMDESPFAFIYQISKQEAHTIRETIKDTLIYDTALKESFLFRQLHFSHCTSSQCYSVIVRKSLVDHNQVLTAIFTDVFIICLVVVAVITLLNLYIFKRIWSPFHKMIRTVSEFQLDKDKAYESIPSSILEFRELDKTITVITQKLQAEYNELKFFTAYLTHELQTPLAVMKAEIDLMLQEEKLSPEQIKRMLNIRHQIEIISRFEQAAILLKRIDLGKFKDEQTLNFSNLLLDKLDETEELIHLKSIQLKKEITPGVTLSIHPELADALLNNILSNSIRHNIMGGEIQIKLTSRYLQLINSTEKSSTRSNPDHNQHENESLTQRGLGVGLSIIAAICKKYKFHFHTEKKQDQYVSIIQFDQSLPLHIG